MSNMEFLNHSRYIRLIKILKYRAPCIEPYVVVEKFILVSQANIPALLLFALLPHVISVLLDGVELLIV